MRARVGVCVTLARQKTNKQTTNRGASEKKYRLIPPHITNSTGHLDAPPTLTVPLSHGSHSSGGDVGITVTGGSRILGKQEMSMEFRSLSSSQSIVSATKSLESQGLR